MNSPDEGGVNAKPEVETKPIDEMVCLFFMYP